MALTGLRRWLLVVLLAVVFGAASAPVASAYEFTGATDLWGAMNMFATGQATPAQREEAESFIDWTEYNSGVNANQMSFEEIDQPGGGQTYWNVDPMEEAYQNTESAATAAAPDTAGSTLETDVASELENFGADLGFNGGPESAVSSMDVCLDTAIVGCLAAADVAVGGLVYSEINDGLGGGDNVTPTSNEANIAEVRRMWMPVPSGTAGTCTTQTVNSGVEVFTQEVPYPTSGPTGDPFPIPCKSEAPGGGVYVAEYRLGTAWWMMGKSSVSGSAQGGGGCASSLTSTLFPPYPGTLVNFGGEGPSATYGHWKEHGWSQVEDMLPLTSNSWDGYECDDSSGNAQETWDELGVELSTATHNTFPKAESCPSGHACHNETSYGPSNWCSYEGIATCFANELAMGGVGSGLDGPYSALGTFGGATLGGTNSGCGCGGGAPGTPIQQPGTFTVPGSCVGESYSACAAALATLGFTGTITTYVEPPAGAVLTIPAGDVVNTSPAPGSVVDLGAPMTLDTNPTPLPLQIPSFAPNEVFTTYQTQLDQLGFTDVVNDPVSATNENPADGPNAVLSVSPAVGTAAAPATEVDVETNPADAPSGGVPLPSAACGLTPPSAAVNFGPITGLSFGSVFPFSVIPWLQTVVGSVPAGQAPDLSFAVFGATIDATPYIGSTFDPVFSAIRSVLAVLLWLSAAWVLYRRITGVF